MIPEKSIKNKKNRVFKKRKNEAMITVTEERSNNPVSTPGENNTLSNIPATSNLNKTDNQNIQVIENASAS